jgi:hypothetical protein
MKRIFALAALLVAASACAPAEQGTGSNSNLAADAARTATPQPSPAAVSDADIIAADRQLWEAVKAKNWDAFASGLTDDHLAVLADAVHDKASVLDGIRQLDLTDYSLADAKVLKLDADAAVLIYTSTIKATYQGKPLPDTPSRDGNVYVKRGDRWLSAFRQETAAAPAPAATASPAAHSNSAASNTNANSNAAASPAASPAAAPANVTEAEKQVWDALKRKDWDAFAAFLAEDQLEVEPGGVHTKAQSVEAVKGFDFSTATLSDFKETKLSANATLLTYLVKGRGRDWPPDGFRSSTVWVNRGGKWLAVFHQATVATK